MSKTLDMTKDALQAFSKALTEDGVPSQMFDVSAENVIQQLLVPVLPENPNSPIIQIMYVDDILEVSNILTKKPEDYFILQLFVPFNFPEKKFAPIDMYNLFGFMNKVIPVGYFGLSDAKDEGAFFRHTLVTPQKKLDSDVLLETIRIINFFVARFYGKIFDLASGSKGLDQVLTEINEEIKV